jgi:hypothetical protein
MFKKLLRSPLLLAVIPGTFTLLVGWQVSAESNRVEFPINLDSLVHYTTVRRGDVTEHMLTSREALNTIRAGQPIPNGT